ncbi:MAG: hypothetical protein INQ03_05360 [Candidatus Heimdallarchaeota archaeon]|nr:hypothetical protein [Candidatus Heimdallarchaeota archaeon]
MTEFRKKASGNYIVQLNEDAMMRLGVKHNESVVIVLEDHRSEMHQKSCLGKVMKNNSLRDSECRLDLTIRKRFNILEHDDDWVFGYVSIYKVDKSKTLKEWIQLLFLYIIKIISLFFIYEIIIPNHPRTLLLSARRLQKEDVEKNVTVLHEKYVLLMGLTYGQYVKIKAPLRVDYGKYKIASASSRLFSGIGDEKEIDLKNGNVLLEPYPDIGNVYLDVETRYQMRLMGLEKRYEKEWPIVQVSPDIIKFINERILFFLVSFIVVIRQLQGLLDYLIIIDKYLNFLISTILSLWITTLIVYVEIRNKTHY